MKIDRIEIFPLVGLLSEPFGWSQRWTDRRNQTIVRVTSDDGAYGLGETFGNHETLPAYRALAETVVGEDPMRRAAIWNRIVGDVYQGGGFAGLATGFLSALDMALHDLLARDQGIPVSELLGGRVRDKVAVYATGLYYTPDDLEDKTWARFLDEGRGYAEQGFTGMKMKIGGLPMREDADRVHALRREVGDEVRIMVDANEAYDPMSALRMAEMMADADVTWFEEACSSRNLPDNQYVTERSPIPTSGGESMRTRRDAATDDARPRLRHPATGDMRGRRHLGAETGRQHVRGTQHPIRPALLGHRHKLRVDTPRTLNSAGLPPRGGFGALRQRGADRVRSDSASDP